MLNKKSKVVLSILITLLFLVSGISMAAYQPTREYEGTTISYYSFPHGPDYNRNLKKVLDKFKELTGIEVEITMLSWGEGNRNILSAIAAGDAPDVMYTTPSRALPIITFGDNVIEPLDDYIDKELKEEIVFNEALENYKFGGTTYALGHYGDPHQFAANLDVLRESGVEESYIEKMTNPDKKWTWDDWIYMMEKATRDTNGDGNIDQWGLSYPGGANNASPFLHFYWNTGGKVVDTEGNIGIGGEETLLVLKFFEEMLNKGLLIDGVANMSASESDNAVFESKSAFNYTFPPEIYIARDESGEELPEVVPVYPPESPTGKRGSFFAWNGVMMSARSENKGAAWELIKYLTISDEYKEMIAKATGKLTPVTTESDIQELIKEEYRGLLNIALDASSRGWYLRHEPAHPASGRIVRAYNSAVQNVLSGNMNAEEATNWLKEEAKAAVEEVE
ncbi:ABC-type glycerol-3-phosphate transport system substrate-binding protein [Halanaerobium saccharolyticum]|uniref:ABC-type glycerol-3-phosphate transport system substrate-binding protein n=1 Tax=Halanaerobium saccharolyticum TaxID=43595 RepID=A0A4R6LRW6_9FIRM|nr:extracellular solute-binding protein [Halanaerobium saccharolyticum]TDO91329.1 ABC-type glycerol-3-phosphate transport system substrate-binding protein [Halanaerobium saccharolyticum]